MPRPLLAPLAARSPAEKHRAATPLELFFDLVIVVAVARAAAGLHHALADGHAIAGIHAYAMAFFGVWWAWVNFTWFASAYDNDDVIYRLLVLVQLSGALVFAAGIGAWARGELAVAVIGYVIMRVALVIQWLRVARSDPPRRTTGLRYAIGIFAIQCAWVGFVFAAPAVGPGGFWILAAVELVVPVWAESAEPTTWHPGHIVERYGLLTIICLGESILAASLAFESASATGVAPIAPIAAGGLLTVFACFWLYFDRPARDRLTSMRETFLWGYGHYLVFAAAAGIGAGIAVALDQRIGRSSISSVDAGAAVALPAALFLVSLWFLLGRDERTLGARVTPLFAAAIALSPLTGHGVLATGLLLWGLVAFKSLRVRLGA